MRSSSVSPRPPRRSLNRERPAYLQVPSSSVSRFKEWCEGETRQQDSLLKAVVTKSTVKLIPSDVDVVSIGRVDDKNQST